MGYTITTYGTCSAPLKYPKLTPPDAGNNNRFDTLGKDYTLRRLSARVYENNRHSPSFAAPRPIQGVLIQKRNYKMIWRPAKKLTGLPALYFKYRSTLILLLSAADSPRQRYCNEIWWHTISTHFEEAQKLRENGLC